MNTRISNKVKPGELVVNTEHDNFMYVTQQKEVDIINREVDRGVFRIRLVICDTCNGDLGTHYLRVNNTYTCEYCLSKLFNNTKEPFYDVAL